MSTGTEPAAIRRTCRDCNLTFYITAGEREFLQNLSVERSRPFVLPHRCLDCRQAARRAKYARAVDPDAGDEMLMCTDCGAAFTFGGRDREYWARQGWTSPKRCRDCRRQRATTR
jgi:hypothetical protein